MLHLGEVTLAVLSDVRVLQQETQSGWKGGTEWHKLCLVPLPASAPVVAQRWTLEGAEDPDKEDPDKERHCMVQ